jgi:hypothetical protein
MRARSTHGQVATTTTAPDADNHKESLHFFPNNQQVIVRLIKNRNRLPEGAFTDDVLHTINTSHDLCRFSLSYHSIKRYFFNLDVIPRRAPRVEKSRQRKLQAERDEFLKLSADEKEFVRIRETETKLSLVPSRINVTIQSVY